MNKLIEQLTSVSINTASFNDFKKESIGTGTNLKKLVEFSVKLYLVDSKFKERVDSHTPGGNVSATK